MILIDRRRQADAAAVALRARERSFMHKTRVFRAYCSRHRAALIVGSGFASGVIMSWMPIAPFMRLASAFASTVSLMLNGPVAGFLAGYRSGGSQAPETQSE